MLILKGWQESHLKLTCRLINVAYSTCLNNDLLTVCAFSPSTDEGVVSEQKGEVEKEGALWTDPAS